MGPISARFGEEEEDQLQPTVLAFLEIVVAFVAYADGIGYFLGQCSVNTAAKMRVLLVRPKVVRAEGGGAARQRRVREDGRRDGLLQRVHPHAFITECHGIAVSRSTHGSIAVEHVTLGPPRLYLTITRNPGSGGRRRHRRRRRRCRRTSRKGGE
eukprot:2897304-Prymnesium_polylepis.1